MNFIIGAGGFAKEVAWLFYEAFQTVGKNQNICAFVVGDDSKETGLKIHGHPIIHESEFIELTRNKKANIYIGIGDGETRKKIVEKHKKNNPDHIFPPLIHPSVIYDKRPGVVEIHEGAIICAGCILTTDIVINSFAQVNLNWRIQHDKSRGAHFWQGRHWRSLLYRDKRIHHRKHQNLPTRYRWSRRNRSAQHIIAGNLCRNSCKDHLIHENIDAAPWIYRMERRTRSSPPSECNP
jgi:PglD N-terminal domain